MHDQSLRKLLCGVTMKNLVKVNLLWQARRRAGRSLAPMIVIAATIAITCGTQDTESLLDDNTPLSALSDQQRIDTCVSIAQKLGGFGMRQTCADGRRIRTFASQSECTDKLTSLCQSSKLGQLLNCINDLSKNPCTTAAPANCNLTSVCNGTQ